MKALRIQQAEKQNTYFNPMVIYRLNLVPQRETNIFTSLETLKYLPQTKIPKTDGALKKNKYAKFLGKS